MKEWGESEVSLSSKEFNEIKEAYEICLKEKDREIKRLKKLNEIYEEAYLKWCGVGPITLLTGPISHISLATRTFEELGVTLPRDVAAFLIKNDILSIGGMRDIANYAMKHQKDKEWWKAKK